MYITWHIMLLFISSSIRYIHFLLTNQSVSCCHTFSRNFCCLEVQIDDLSVYKNMQMHIHFFVFNKYWVVKSLFLYESFFLDIFWILFELNKNQHYLICNKMVVRVRWGEQLLGNWIYIYMYICYQFLMIVSSNHEHGTL